MEVVAKDALTAYLQKGYDLVHCFGDGQFVVRTAGGLVACSMGDLAVGQQATVFFRPENCTVLKNKPHNARGLAATVSELQFLGEVVDCHLKVGDSEQIRVRLHPKQVPGVGDTVFLAIDRDLCTLLQNEA